MATLPHYHWQLSELSLLQCFSYRALLAKTNVRAAHTLLYKRFIVIQWIQDNAQMVVFEVCQKLNKEPARFDV